MTQSLHATVWYFIVIWLQNLTRAMHVYLTSTLSMCKTSKLEYQWQLHSVSLTVHEATWHMWRRCRDFLAWFDHSDVLLVPEECTRPP